MLRCIIAALALACAVSPAMPAALETCARLYAITGLGGQMPGYSLGVFTEADRDCQVASLREDLQAGLERQEPHLGHGQGELRDRRPTDLLDRSQLGRRCGAGDPRWLANDSIPVATVFSYDPTRTQSGCVPTNVQTFINWRGTRLLNLGRGNPQPCAANIATAMQDYPLNVVSHVLIDDLPTVHELTTKHVGDVLHMIHEMKGGS